MKITISGAPGSGKSTIARMLAEKLHYKFFSVGNIRRRMAEARGLTILQYNALKEDTDTEVDNFQKRVGEQDDNFVLEGRLGYMFIPDSFKVYFDCSVKVAAGRIFKNQRSSEERFSSIEDAERAVIKRVEGDKTRYKEIYGISYPELARFDLVLDTSESSPEEVFKQVLEALEKRKKK